MGASREPHLYVNFLIPTSLQPYYLRMLLDPHGGDVLLVLVRDSPPLPALRARVVANGQQLPAIHMVVPKAPENYFSFPMPIFSTLHANTILEPNLDSNAHPNPQPTPHPTPKPYP